MLSNSNIEAVNRFLVRADQVFDYVPFVSSVTNFIDLLQKAVCVPSEPTSHYYTHIKDKSMARCVALLVPVVGNLLILVGDLWSHCAGGDPSTGGPNKSKPRQLRLQMRKVEESQLESDERLLELLRQKLK